MFDLKTFYTAFTGNEIMPENIQHFSDIKLKDYGRMKGCVMEGEPFKNPVKISKKNKVALC